MIKIIKLGDLIHQNIEEKIIDKNGNEVWSIPTDLTELKQIAVDTVNWVIGNKVKKAFNNNQTALSSANSKAITLLAKLISTLNPDISTLTELEKLAYDKIVASANSGYADSQLLNSSLDVVAVNLQVGGKAIADIQNATTIDEVIAVLNSL